MVKGPGLGRQELLEGLAARIHELMRASKLSQQSLGQAWGRDASYVSDVVNAKTSPRADELAILMQLTGVSGHWLLMGKGSPTDKVHTDLVIARESKLLALREIELEIKRLRERYEKDPTARGESRLRDVEALDSVVRRPPRPPKRRHG